jgi:hypothetical protein
MVFIDQFNKKVFGQREREKKNMGGNKKVVNLVDNRTEGW